MELEGSECAISAESIYRHAYSPAGRRAGLPRLLAQCKPKRGRRRRNGRREPAIPNRTPIHQRPTKAHLRSQFGHWEGDLMHFRRQRDILLTLQERRSRLTLTRRLQGKDADLTAQAMPRSWADCPPLVCYTITHDNVLCSEWTADSGIGSSSCRGLPARLSVSRVQRVVNERWLGLSEQLPGCG